MTNVLRRLLLLTVAALVLLIVVIAGAAYWFFARDGFRLALEAQATSWLGHPVHIGAARAQFLPRLAVESPVEAEVETDDSPERPVDELVAG